MRVQRNARGQFVAGPQGIGSRGGAVQAICEWCSAAFWRQRAHVTGRLRFCSLACRRQSWRAQSQVPRICEYCGAPFTARPSEIKAGLGRFCRPRCHADSMKRPLRERFWLRVDKNGPAPAHRPELGPCWLWTGRTNSNGYGMIDTGRGESDSKAMLATREAWALASGEAVPGDFYVCHTCDTPLCVRNDEPGTYVVEGVARPRFGHLFLGTQADNVHDMDAKGRGVTGARHPGAKLTDTAVRLIRQRHAAGGISQAALAREYGINQSVISRIVRQKTWRHSSTR